MGCHPYLILKLFEYDRRAFLFVTFGIWPSVLMHKTHFLYNWVYFWLTRFGFNFPENIFCNVLNSGESSFPRFSLHKFENLAIINETIGILDNNLCFFASRTIGHGCIVFQLFMTLWTSSDAPFQQRRAHRFIARLENWLYIIKSTLIIITLFNSTKSFLVKEIAWIHFYAIYRYKLLLFIRKLEIINIYSFLSKLIEYQILNNLFHNKNSFVKESLVIILYKQQK